ncbi:MAG: ribonuclease H family protein, partial [Candidatus Thiodiazotropha endolucinida]
MSQSWEFIQKKERRRKQKPFYSNFRLKMVNFQMIVQKWPIYHFVWGKAQQGAFEKIKTLLASSEILALYDPKKETIVAAGSSRNVLGVAVIELEALAICYGVEKFENLLLGKYFHIQTNHKPMVSLLGKKILVTFQ